jgi:hypothetical protein
MEGETGDPGASPGLTRNEGRWDHEERNDEGIVRVSCSGENYYRHNGRNYIDKNTTPTSWFGTLHTSLLPVPITSWLLIMTSRSGCGLLHFVSYADFPIANIHATLDAKTDLLTGLLAGKQGWKCRAPTDGRGIFTNWTNSILQVIFLSLKR